MYYGGECIFLFFFFSSRRRHTRCSRDWSSDVALPISGRRGRPLNIWNWLAVGGAAVLALAVVAALRRRVRATAPGRRFFRHPTAGPGVFVLTFFVTIAFAAPVVAPYPPYYQIDIEHPNHPPSAQFLLGTDPLSRDVWSRVVYGARVSLGIGAVAMRSEERRVGKECRSRWSPYH